MTDLNMTLGPIWHAFKQLYSCLCKKNAYYLASLLPLILIAKAWKPSPALKKSNAQIEKQIFDPLWMG